MLATADYVAVGLQQSLAYVAVGLHQSLGHLEHHLAACVLRLHLPVSLRHL